MKSQRVSLNVCMQKKGRELERQLCFYAEGVIRRVESREREKLGAEVW